MNKLTRNCFYLTAAAAGVLSVSAQAAKITEWGYVNEAGFANYQFQDTGGTGITASGSSDGGNGSIFPGGTPLPTSLTWGTGVTATGGTGQSSSPSSLNLISPETSATNGSAFTDGGWNTGTNMTHDNQYITGDYLTFTNILDALALQPLAWDDPLIPTPGPFLDGPLLSFNILFKETDNQVSGTSANPIFDGICEDTQLANGEGINAGGCADIFLFNGVDLDDQPIDFTFEDEQVFFSSDFIVQDYKYTVTTRLGGLALQEIDDCFGIDGQSNCVGFLTEENGLNTLSADFRVTSRQITVPEPTTVAIMGLALFGLSFARRRA
ncbi:THxN family PEP-CTERM protein [Alginatibacterium sediminis]|nr:THxN family PEP-CTERM protein [Alginatibacterium sediminis]